jgi:Epoxide hydrolase N terminus
MTAAVEPFAVAVPQAVLDDLAERLARTRWPIDPGNADWRYGTERGYLEELVAYWRGGYDWRAQERAMNASPTGARRSRARRSTSSTRPASAPTPCRWSSPTAGPGASGTTTRSFAP